MTHSKNVDASRIHNVEVVLPNDTNSLGILLGGRLLNWMDLVAAICAQTHANGPCVTASIDKVTFERPVKLGELVHVEAQVTRAFNSSMEILVRVSKQIPKTGEKLSANQAFFTFVALDEEGKPRPIPALEPITETEIKLYNSAEERRKLRKQ